jgi:hypothetical protein
MTTSAGIGFRDGAVGRALRLPLREWQLPHLNGTRGTILILLYLILATASLVVVGGSWVKNARDYFYNIPVTASWGIRTQTGNSIPSITAYADPTVAGGHPVVSIGGQVPTPLTEFAIADLLARARSPVTVVVRAGEVERRVVLTRRALSWDTSDLLTGVNLWLYIVLGFLATQLPATAWLVASLILARRRARDPEAMLFAVGFLLMSIQPNVAFWLAAEHGLPELPFKVAFNIGNCLVLAAIAGFPDGRFRGAVQKLALGGACLLALLILAGGIGKHWLEPVLTGSLLLALWPLIVRYRNSSSQTHQQQIKWAVFGMGAALIILIPITGARSLGLVPRGDATGFFVNELALPLAYMLIPLGLLVSLLQYRLYDAEAAISRSAGYAILTLMLAAAFAGCQEGTKWFFESSLGGTGGALTGAIGAGLAVALVTPLHQRVHGWAEERFRRTLLRLRRNLPPRVEDLRETADMQRLAQETLERCSEAVRAEHGALIVRGRPLAARGVDSGTVGSWLKAASLSSPETIVHCVPSDPLFPVRVALRTSHSADEPIGWLLLGPRPDSSLYGSGEREALAEVAEPVARAMQVVELRERRELEHETRLREHEQRFAQLEQAFTELVARFTAGLPARP